MVVYSELSASFFSAQIKYSRSFVKGQGPEGAEWACSDQCVEQWLLAFVGADPARAAATSMPDDFNGVQASLPVCAHGMRARG